MRRPCLPLVLAFAFAAAPASGQQATQTLLEARRGHTTTLSKTVREKDPLVPAPASLFSLVKYPTALGPMSAYVSTRRAPGRSPAIIWITGGFPPGGVGESAWQPLDPDNDQSAQGYRHAGMVIMYPALRGSFGNPGRQESFYGEVDDILAAADFLAKQDHVDPSRIYLGGHSTGGTLVLLVATATDRFRGIIAYGPVADPATYGARSLSYDPRNARERRLRAPVHFIGAIKTPTYVIEGTERSNADELPLLAKAGNPKLRTFAIRGAGHFDVLAPLNRLIAAKIVGLASGASLSLTAAELQSAYVDYRAAQREAEDLGALASARRSGVDLRTPREVRYILLSRNQAALTAAAAQARAAGFEPDAIQPRKSRDGRPYYLLIVRKTLVLRDLDAVFAASKTLAGLAARGGLQYNGWSAN